jgi:purine-nucleoside phosphorylase
MDATSASERERLDACAALIAPVVQRRGTRAFVVLGSGLAGVADELTQTESLPFAALPGWPLPTVTGHDARLVFGLLDGVEVAVATGRVHLYEGRSAAEVAFGVRVAALAGIEAAILTNAAGSLHDDLPAGTVVVVTDQLNLTGTSPLIGPADDRHGPRFPAMAGAFDAGMTEAALAAGRAADLPVRPGVYAGVTGPAFETAAEARMLAILGADVVGMSTVTETIAAVHAGMRVAALSLVTNRSGSNDDSHAATLQAAQRGARAVRVSLTGCLSTFR